MPRVALNQTFVEDGVRWIALTQGQRTCLDESDWPSVRGFIWCAHRRNGKFYAATNVTDAVTGKRKTVSLHSILFPDAETVDHHDSDGLNNRRLNLRPATQPEQVRNRRKSSGFSSTFKGVSWHSQHMKWYATVGHLGKKHFLGLFTDETGAARAYDKSASKFFGDFAKLNFPKTTL